MEVQDSTHILVSIECTVETTKIDFVDLAWFVPPVKGETPSSTPLKTPDDGGYWSGNVYWYKDGTSFEGTFTPGNTYTATIPVVAQEGYEFLYNATAKINNLPATVEVQDSTHILVSIEFTLESTQIDTIHITDVLEPVAGQTPTITIPTADLADVVEISWYKNGEAFSGQFEAGHKYTAKIVISPKDATEFHAAMAAFVNGKTATVTQDGEMAVITVEFIALASSEADTTVSTTPETDPPTDGNGGNNSDTDEPAPSKGCSGALGLSSLGMLLFAALGAMVTVKRKE